MTHPTEAPAGAAPSRLPVILGAGLAAVVLIFVLTRLVGGGDDVDETTTPTTTSGVRTTTTTTTAPPAGQPVETFEVFTSKNPFQPLRVVGGGGGGATTGGTTTGGTTTGGTSTGGTSTGGTTTGGRTTGGTTTGGTSTGGTSTGGTTTGGASTGGTSTGGTSGGSTSPRRSDRVTVVDVFVERGRVVANVRVNDTVHKVGVGDTFATSYKVLSLSQADECGRFAFGDDTFRLCRGEQTLK